MRKRMHVRRAAAVIAAAALMLGLTACSAGKPAVVPSDDGVEPAVTVRVVDNKFIPDVVDIQAGEAVQWVFEGVSAKHDVVADDGSFVSELQYEGTYTKVFADPGSFGYDCSIHPEMTGVVNVE